MAISRDVSMRRAARWPAVFPTLAGYQRAWLLADLVAGVTLAAIALPEQMATAGLVHMPPVAGLYAFVVGSLAIAAFGSTRQLSVGADSTIAPILAAGATGVAVAGSTRYVHALVLLSLLVGVLVVLAAVARLGWIANLLSVPVTRGMLAGIGIEIAVRQLPAVLGLAGGGSSVIDRLRTVGRQLHDTNGWSLGIAAGALAIVVGAELIDHRLPGALLAVVASTIVVDAGGLTHHGVRVVGALHPSWPHVAIPSAHGGDLAKLAAAAFTAAFLIVIQTATTAHQAGSASGTTSELERDLFGIGVGGLVSGGIGSFAVNASPPRTAAVLDAGGRSQAAGIAAAGVVVAALAVGAGAIRDLPSATLGAILLYIAWRLLRPGTLLAVWRFSRVEFGLAAVTILAVVLIGIEQGVLVAIVLSLAYRTRLAARPQDAVLGRAAGGDHWVDPATASTEQVAGVLVYFFGGPLWFGDAQFVADRIRRQIDAAAQPLSAFVLDAAAVSDADYTGVLAFGSLVDDLGHRGIAVGVARASEPVRRALSRQSPVGAVRYFGNVEEAVQALRGGPMRTPTPGE